MQHGLQVDRQQHDRCRAARPSCTIIIALADGERRRPERAQVEQGAVGALQHAAGEHERDQPDAADDERRPQRARRRRAAGGLRRRCSARRRGRRSRAPTAPPTARRPARSSSSPTFVIRRRPSTSATERDRQDEPEHGTASRTGSARRPRRSGPIAGATEMTIEMLPITRAAAGGRHQRHDGGHQQREHDRGAAGLDDPGGEQHREARRDRRERACPRLNSVIAVPKSDRVGTRWIRKPVTGMTTDIVSRKPAVSHWPTLASTCRSVMQHRQRDAHDRLVEDDDERRDEQHPDDRAVAGAELPRGVGCARPMVEHVGLLFHFFPHVVCGRHGPVGPDAGCGIYGVGPTERAGLIPAGVEARVTPRAHADAFR